MGLTRRFLEGGVITPITTLAEQREWQEKLLDASFGRNTVEFNDVGHPSVVVIVPCEPASAVLPGATDDPHPAFIINGVVQKERKISKYHICHTGSGINLRTYCVKGVDPGHSLSFDDFLLANKQNGPNCSLSTNAEAAFLSLKTKSLGFFPRGNNNWGQDISVPSEKGIPSFFSSNKPARTLTGSGPISWSHDGTPFGIFGLNGLLWRRVGGMRSNFGEINILENNNAADNTKDQSATSVEWKAILEDGTLVAPGTPLTLKFDGIQASGGAAQIDNVLDFPANTSLFNTFETLTADSHIVVPNILKLLGLFPVDGNHGGDGLWVNNTIEALLMRGGSLRYGSPSGVAAVRLFFVRAYAIWTVGALSAWS